MNEHLALISRRRLLELTAMSGLFGLLGCTDSADGRPAASDISSTTTGDTSVPARPEIDVAFAEPWSALATPAVVWLGAEVLRVVPDAVDHARAALGAIGDDDPASVLARACAVDGRSGHLTDVATWMLPRTLAGLSAALAALA